MADKIDDGGPVLLKRFDDLSLQGQPAGVMNLRDWFAGQALAGLSGIFHGSPSLADEAALRAYQTADAMIRARATHKD